MGKKVKGENTITIIRKINKNSNFLLKSSMKLLFKPKSKKFISF